MNKRFILFLSIFLSMLVLDQGVKEWVRQAMVERGSSQGLPWPGVFELTLTYNKGIAFGLFQGLGVLLSPVAIAIAVGAGIYSWRHPRETVWTHTAMGLLASGAIGNLYDRVAHGRVTDMFYFRLIDFPVFNIADACITIATIILIVTWTFEGTHHKNEPAASRTPETSAAETE